VHSLLCHVDRYSTVLLEITSCLCHLFLASPLAASFPFAGLEEGWKKIKDHGIERLEKALKEGLHTSSDGGAGTSGAGGKNVSIFKQSQTMELYHVIYVMATQKSPNNFSEQLYQRHNESIRTYLRTHTLQQIRSKRGEQLLSKLVAEWDLHAVMNKWMFKLFQYLDR
jgi:cullin 1